MAQELLNIFDEVKDLKGMVSGLLDIMAGLAVARENWKTSAWFLGIADGQYSMRDYHREPADEQFARPIFDRTLNAMDEETYQSIYHAGERLTTDEALAEVRKELAKSD